MAKIKVGVTGGIGAGKSTVMDLLKQAGYFTVSCDSVTAKLYNRYFVKKGLKKLFPNVVSGAIFLKVDKKTIASEVFSNKQKLDALNAFFHPLIMKEIEKKLCGAKDKIAFAEVPLLFEGDFSSAFDKIIIVDRALEQRIDSVKTRSHLTESEIMDRVRNQVDYDAMDKSPYCVLQNNGDITALKTALFSLVDEWKSNQ